MEPFSFFLSTLTALADRIINLEKTKLQDRQSLFNEIIKPLFEDMELVATKYMDFFKKAKNLINKNPKKDLKIVANSLEEERHAMVVALVKVREAAKQIEENVKDEEIEKFASDITEFFYKAALPRFSFRFGSKAKTLITIIRDARNEPKQKEIILEYIEDTLDSLEQAWGSIVRSYEAIKIHSTTSPKYIRNPKNK